MIYRKVLVKSMALTLPQKVAEGFSKDYKDIIIGWRKNS